MKQWITSRQRETAKFMKWELETQKLVVTLAPSEIREVADKGGKIRVVEEHNPDWYRELCNEYRSGRRKPRRRKKADTLIKRQSVLRALDEIISGRVETIYAERVFPYVEEQNAQYEKLWAEYERNMRKGT